MAFERAGSPLAFGGRSACWVSCVAVLLALSLGGVVLAAARTRPEPCPGGLFLSEDGAPLVAGADVPLGGALRLGTESIAIEPGCAPVAVRLRARRTKTTVKAKWPAGTCGGIDTTMRLQGAVAAPACDVIDGRLRVKKAKPPTRALRVRRLAVSASVVSGTLTVDGTDLGTEEVPASVETKVGDLRGPASLGVAGSDLLVLDPVNARIVRFPNASPPFEVLDAGEFYATALDLLPAGDALFVAGARACRCARRITGNGGAGTDLPVAENHYPGRLTGDTRLLAVDGPSGLHAVVRDGAPVPLDAQDAAELPGVPHPGLGLSLVAELPDALDATTLRVLGVRDDGTVALDASVELLGAPDSVELLAPACGDGIVVAARVLAEGAAATSVARLDRDGRVVARAREAAPRETGPTPLRRFAVGGDGRVFELRTTGEGYAIVVWPTGC
jgi:hypothetical protein